jgi:hypothetical protein
MKEPKMNPLTIEPEASPLLSQTVSIEALTPEAEQFIKENAGRFGDLYKTFSHRWNLWVYRGYDRAEVIEYLVDLWASRAEHWPAEVDEASDVEDRFKPGGFWFPIEGGD